MDIDLDFCNIFCCGNPEEKRAMIPIDCSIVLPDYFPDVMKILRYTAKTVKSPVFSEGGAETVSGNINVEVSYVSEEGELCSCSQLRPFSHSFDCRGKIPAAECSVKVGEIGCRAVNKRRIDLHGNLEVVLRALRGEEKKIVSSVKGAGAVCKNKNVDTVVPVGEFFKNFTAEEKGVIEEGMPDIGKIIRTRAFAEINECHVIQDKIVTKGEVKAEILWTPENDDEGAGPFISVFSYPVSRMTEAEGILLTDICDAKYEADFPEISVSGDGRVFDIKVRVGIFSRVYRKEKTEYAEDMFSTDFESGEEKNLITMINEAIPVSVRESLYEKIDLPETVSEICDIWVEADEPELSEQNEIAVKAKICMFAKDGEENPVYFEKETEKVFPSGAGDKKTAFYNLSALVGKTEFGSKNPGKADISSEIFIDGTIYTALSTEALTACSINTEKKIEHRSTSMVLCYAEKGEEIWDIARRYRVSPKNILDENGMENEILEKKTMLVITR